MNLAQLFLLLAVMAIAVSATAFFMKQTGTMIKNVFTFKAGDETISGVVLRASSSSDLPRCVSFHGAGLSAKEGVFKVIFEPLAQLKIDILAIDFSGHGASTGELKKGSLKKRVSEAKLAIDQLSRKENLIFCGLSMGGYVALKMLELYKVDTLILFCPALYDAKGYAVPFDQGFTEIIRQPNSWRNTDVLPALESFTGKLLVVMGENDEVIPKGVIELIDLHTPRAYKKEIYTIPHCPHKIDLWIVDQPVELVKLQQKILEFLV